MKGLTAISTAALLALALPAFAQNSPATSGAGTNSSQPSGQPGATGGTDPKLGGASGMTEGRSSVNEPNSTGAMKNGTSGTNGATNNNMAPGGGPGDAGGTSK